VVDEVRPQRARWRKGKRALAVLRDFRRIADALERLASSAQQIRANAPALDRLEALELSRAQFEADIDGVLMKAESRLKAAANAESRERHLRKKNEEAEFDQFDAGRPAREEALPVGDAEDGEAEGMHVLRVGMAPTGKAYALAAKYS